MNKTLIATIALSLAACSADPLAQPVPEIDDMEAIQKITRQLDEDGGYASEKMLFAGWAMRENSVAVGLIPDPTPNSQASTVGEAIAEQRKINADSKAEQRKREIEMVESNCESTKPTEFGLTMTWPDGYTFDGKEYEGPCEALAAQS